MPRGATVVYPKDAAQPSSGWLTSAPVTRVLEAGVGSGALTMLVAPSGRGRTGSVHSYERRDDFAAVARDERVTAFFGTRADVVDPDASVTSSTAIAT
jgi:tRNA (adenine57-N1/adenine58-N1)-methyltransferase catalytic subunit